MIFMLVQNNQNQIAKMSKMLTKMSKTAKINRKMIKIKI